MEAIKFRRPIVPGFSPVQGMHILGNTLIVIYCVYFRVFMIQFKYNIPIFG